MIEFAKNLRDKLILKVLYGTGLRVSELCNLRRENFQFDKTIGTIKKGKGNKDRLFYFNH